MVLEYLMLLAAKKGGRLVWVNVPKICRTQNYQTKKEICNNMYYIPKILNTQSVFFSLGLPLYIKWSLRESPVWVNVPTGSQDALRRDLFGLYGVMGP